MRRLEKVIGALMGLIVGLLIIWSMTAYAMEKRGNTVPRVAPVNSLDTLIRTGATDTGYAVSVDVRADYQEQVRVVGAPTFYWKFDNDYTDAMGLATAGTASVGVFGTAKYGAASASLNGTNGYINVPHHASMNFGTTTDYTVEFWFKLSSNPASGASYIFVDHRSSANVGTVAYIFNNSGTYVYGIKLAATNYFSAAITPDTNWHHLAWVLDRDASVTLYIDGVMQTIAGTPNQNTNATSQLTIGGQSYSQPGGVTNGLIDEVTIYRRLLTQDEILKHYNNSQRPVFRGYNSTGTGGVDIDFSGLGNIGYPYAQLSSSATQTLTAANTAYAIALNTDDYKNFVTHSTVTSNSRVQIDIAGTYLITHSTCIQAATPSDHINIWLAVNGTKVDRSNTKLELPISGEAVMTVNYIQSFTAGQYFELYAMSSAANMLLLATSATTTAPASSASIVTVNKISR